MGTHRAATPAAGGVACALCSAQVMLKLALRLMRNSVKRKAGCDISTVSPLDVVPRSAIPAMFGHGEEDSFINIQHSGVKGETDACPLSRGCRNSPECQA